MNLETYTPPKIERSKITNERQNLLKMFLDVKVDGIMVRKGSTFVPISPSRLGFALSHIPTEDLYAFYKQCENAKHFGKYFWWALKPQK